MSDPRDTKHTRALKPQHAFLEFFQRVRGKDKGAETHLEAPQVEGVVAWSRHPVAVLIPALPPRPHGRHAYCAVGAVLRWHHAVVIVRRRQESLGEEESWAPQPLAEEDQGLGADPKDGEDGDVRHGLRVEKVRRTSEEVEWEDETCGAHAEHIGHEHRAAMPLYCTPQDLGNPEGVHEEDEGGWVASKVVDEDDADEEGCVEACVERGERLAHHVPSLLESARVAGLEDQKEVAQLKDGEDDELEECRRDKSREYRVDQDPGGDVKQTQVGV